MKSRSVNSSEDRSPKFCTKSYETWPRVFGLKHARGGLDDRFTRAAYDFDTTRALSVLSCLLQDDITDPFISRSTLIFPPSRSFWSLWIASAATGSPVSKLAQIESDRINHPPVFIAADNLSFFRNRPVSRGGVLLYAGPIKDTDRS